MHYEDKKASSEDLQFHKLEEKLKKEAGKEWLSLDILKTLNLYHKDEYYNIAGELLAFSGDNIGEQAGGKKIQNQEHDGYGDKIHPAPLPLPPSTILQRQVEKESPGSNHPPIFNEEEKRSRNHRQRVQVGVISFSFRLVTHNPKHLHIPLFYQKSGKRKKPPIWSPVSPIWGQSPFGRFP